MMMIIIIIISFSNLSGQDEGEGEEEGEEVFDDKSSCHERLRVKKCPFVRKYF